MWTRRQTRAAVLVAVLIPVGAILALAGQSAVRVVAGAAAVVVAVWLGHRAGFGRRLGVAVGAGAMSGLLALGPGLRMAMRIVAIMEPSRTPEFTIEGTMFVVVFAGLMMGAVFAPSLSLVAALASDRSAGVVFSIIGLILLSLSPELRGELLRFGAGAAVNVPLFGAVLWAHAWLTLRLLRRFLPAGAARDLVDLTPAV